MFLKSVFSVMSEEHLRFHYFKEPFEEWEEKVLCGTKDADKKTFNF